MTRVDPNYQQLFEHAPYLGVVVDPKLAVLIANAEARRLLGAPARDPQGKALFDVLLAMPGSSDWLERLRASYARVLLSNRTVSLSFSARAGVVRVPVLNGDLPALRRRVTGVWHVRHSPVRNAHGALEAIATYAVRLEAAEPALVRDHSEAALAAAMISRGGPVVLSDTGTRAARLERGEDKTDPMANAAMALGVPSENWPVGGVAESGVGRMRALRILLVEDSLDLRETTAEQLRALGHLVTSCPDAEQALQHLDAAVFDLLFTDLTLPKMTGAELARQVLQRYDPMQVVIASGYGRAMANVQTLDAQFLAKPYRFAELETVIAAVSRRLTDS